jgi:ketosteroid isomerase-like protein
MHLHECAYRTTFVARWSGWLALVVCVIAAPATAATNSLLEYGYRVRDAHASSFAEGMKAMNELASPDGYLHVHIPAVNHKQDGEWLVPKADYGAAQAKNMAAINLRVKVNNVRQIGDDLLVLETVYSATLPDGKDVAFDDVILWTFKNGRMVRQIQVATPGMWDTLVKALQAVNAPGYAKGREYWNDEKVKATRYPADKVGSPPVPAPSKNN